MRPRRRRPDAMRPRPRTRHHPRRRHLALLLLALLIAAATAVPASAAPNPPLREVPRSDRAPASERNLACPTGPSSCMTYAGFVRSIGRDARDFWAAQFRRAGIRWQPATQITLPPGRRARSRCNGGKVVTTRTGPFYCPAGRTIFMPLLAIRALIFPTSTDYVPHAFAISYVAAHEWAHHVQSLLGLLQGRSSVSIELQADCFAGVWGFTAWTRQLVNREDILHTMAVANSIGDPPGMPPTSHGTGQQRTRAFLAGFTRGDPSACLTQ